MTPKIYGPDGVPRETTVFTTTLPTRFFRGTMDPGTVDMQISIRGGPFTSDPDLIVFEANQFTFPNPNAFPEGLDLSPGQNLIEVRAVSLVGSLSTPASVQVTLVQTADIGLIGGVPTRIYLERKDQTVLLHAGGVEDSRFQGVNFYASRFAGGGAVGYQRINLDIVADYDAVEETTTLRDFTANTKVALAPDGTPAADPLYVHLSQIQSSTSDVLEHLEDVELTSMELAAGLLQAEQKTLLKTDFVQVVEVPETARSLRTTVNLSVVVVRRIYKFLHGRQFGPTSVPPTISLGEFASLPNTEPLFYVATAVYYDPDLRTEVESTFSAEIVGEPVTIRTVVGTFPSPSRLQVVQEVLGSLLRVQPVLDVTPGSVIRDTLVDPLASEVIKIRFLVDFIARSQSLDTLLAIDGLESDGSSTPVARSPYKQALQNALGLAVAADVQIILDTAFEQLASRSGVFRSPGTKSRGIVTFYTRNKPTATIFLSLGTRVASGTLSFVTTIDAVIPLAQLASYFNPTTGFYSVDVPVEAEREGVAGNLGAGQIRTILSVLPGLSVTNSSRTFGGQNRQGNAALAQTTRGALAGVDTGTERGIFQVAASIAGVEEVTVISAGDALMQRDYDIDYHKHVGGKVDVWIRGVSQGDVTDVFAFTYDVARDVQFVVVGNPLDLVFRAQQKQLSPTHPIAEMLDDAVLGLGFRNASTGSYFDLGGVQILDYRTIQLSSDKVQPTFTFGQVLLGDIRFATSMKFTFTRQPVGEVIRVSGQVSGVLPAANYKLVKPQSPLRKGRSTEAGDYLQILQVGSVPSGALRTVVSELHVLLAEFPEFLGNLGVNPLTIRVFNASRTIEYKGPETPSGIADFVVEAGTATRAVAIRRTPESMISSGQSVLVDYRHAENFTVAYTTNFVVGTAQSVMNQAKHAAADILLKAALPVPVDIIATIALRAGASRPEVDRRLRTTFATFLRSLPQGSALRQSDVLALFDRAEGVSFVQTPLTKMSRSANSVVVGEVVPTSDASEVQLLLGTGLQPYSTPTVRTWLLLLPLAAATSTGGGPDTNYRGVSQDDTELVLRVSNPQSLAQSAGQTYIIGQDGLSIPGYSDDATLLSEKPTLTSLELQALRRTRTQNRVLVSLAVDDSPVGYTYRVTYVVAEVATGTQDLVTDDLEFFEVGNLLLNYTEDPHG